VQYVWRSLRKQKIDLGGRKSWCESNDPQFATKAADVVGLYMAPPDNAVVLCVDEKQSIQALERAQGYLKLPNGRALTGQSHDYKRNGTTMLFAAFEVAIGKVKTAHKKRRRRKEFLAIRRALICSLLVPTVLACRPLFAQEASAKPRPCDWAYVNNFADPDKPIAIELPAGRARAFQAAIHRLIDDLKAALPAARVVHHIETVRADLVENVGIFVAKGKDGEAEPDDLKPGSPFDRYEVNLSD
jgi:hypothetical protein